jgi:8-oxo-dGTP diphosphatase
MKYLHVAAGILKDAAGRVLLTERLCDGPFDGLWEFPGGKIVDGETATAALRRELYEELGIEIDASLPFMALRHEYPDRAVELEFFLVDAWRGTPTGLEGQRLRWVHIAELNTSELLPADAPVVSRLVNADLSKC